MLTDKEAKSAAMAMFGVSDSAKGGKTPAQQQLIHHMSQHPWNFLSAQDPETGKAIIRTKDEIAGAIRPYPLVKKYLRNLVDSLVQDSYDETGAVDVLIIHKSRQMIVTTTCMLVCLWELLFRAAQRIILSKVTEDDAKEILRDKVRAPWANMPDWVRRELPLDLKPEGRATAGSTGSYLLCSAENAAERECRGGTASRLVVDEAAFQDRSRDIFEAGVPMARRITLITTPLAGSPGGRFVKELVYDEVVV